MTGEDGDLQAATTVTPKMVVAPTLIEAARVVVRGPSFNRTKTAGYDVKEGEKILLVEKSTDDPAVTEALVQAMHEIGATVDVFHADIEDRPVDYLDEFRGLMHNIPGVEPDNAFSLWRQRFKWLEQTAVDQGYSLLLQGEAGALPQLDGVRYEGVPWFHRVTFPAAGFPWPLWDLINEKNWRPIWDKGKNAWVELTDPEGTSMRWRLQPEYFEASHYEGHRRRFEPNYYLGHQFGWPTPPFNPGLECEGVIAGTINHFGRPFPHAKAHFEGAKCMAVEGGGEYGDKWRELMELTKDIQYPEYPGPGLFWLWEVAIGTHPKMTRPPAAFTLSGHAAMYERLRAGIIHMGIGTGNHNVSEIWAEENGHPWGHLHIHLQFPTYKLHTAEGEEIVVIENGRLAALDDPEVIELASEYGDPEQILEVPWTPPIPGISVPGDYWKDYARDPAAWIEAYDAERSEVRPG
jgi:hypothetical protein